MNSTPKQIILIRHGEKPGDPALDSEADGITLSTKGFERAGALAPFLWASFGDPDFLFATQASKHSCRPIQTITPLATALGRNINCDYADEAYAALAARIFGDVQYVGKLVLICWHHRKIPELTNAMGGAPPSLKWPPAAFDRVWQLPYPDTAGARTGALPVRNLPRMLLYGDSAA